MKTLIVSLAALAAVSGTALAAGGDDLRSSDTYFGKYSTKHKVQSQATDSNAFAVVKAGKAKLTAFERMNLTAQEDRGDAHESRGASVE